MPDYDYSDGEPSFIDTEGTGFHGVTVLLQAAIGNGEAELFCPWIHPVPKTLEFIRKHVLNPNGVVGFNWTFDQFHIQKLYNILCLFQERFGDDAYPEDHIDDIANLEMEARTTGLCLKPYKVLDLMLFARKNKFQSLMNRKDVRIRSVPTALADKLIVELNNQIVLPDVYFAKKSDPTRRWVRYEVRNELDEIVQGVVDVVLKFAPSTSLKALAKHVGVADASRSEFDEISVEKACMSNEPGWCPYAKAPHKLKDGTFVIPRTGNWHSRWPKWLHRHIDHWCYHPKAREYAAADVDDTRGLYRFFGSPPLGDDDSTLSAMVGSVRWRGFSLDTPALEEQLSEAIEDLKRFNFQWTSPKACKEMIFKHLSEDEKVQISGTSREILEDMSKWKEGETCNDCYGLGCEKCNEGIVETNVPHAVSFEAVKILSARRADKKRADLVKLLMSDRFHPDFKIIGAKSGRMSGGSGMNAQGINSQESVRRCFTLADKGEELDGGDFESFEVSIMAAVYKDPILSKELESGLKIHAVLASFLFDKTYEQVMKTAKLVNDANLYFRGKRSLFALAYGGDEGTLSRRSGVAIDKAHEAFHAWSVKYPTMAKGRAAAVALHTCLVQAEGIGSKVVWREPKEYVESMGGFKRFFTLEYKICKVLYNLAESPPVSWESVKGRITRRDRQQTTLGATRTAVFAAAFNVMSQCIRAAINHMIQSTGAEVTKSFQAKLWELQPPGEHPWVIRTMQVHDEVLVVRTPELESDVLRIKDAFLESYLERIPLLKIGWSRMKSWAETH